MTEFLLGAIAVASATAGLVFLRYYRRTGDRFFLYFAGSFWLESVSRVLSVTSTAFDDSSIATYGLRLVAYGLIVAAVLHKNRPGHTKK